MSKAFAVEAEDFEVETNRSTKSAKSAPKAKDTKRKATKAVIEEEDEEETAVVEKGSSAVDAAKPKKKRKTAQVKAEDEAPLAERTAISSLKKSMYIGAHVSAAGGKDWDFPS